MLRESFCFSSIKQIPWCHVNYIHSFQYKEQIKAICFSESLLISCFQHKTVKDPTKVEMKGNSVSLEILSITHLLTDRDDTKSKKPVKSSVKKKHDNFQYFFFGQEMNEENIILIDGFPEMTNDKCNKNCCCRATVCFCNQLNLDEDDSQEELIIHESSSYYSESKSKIIMNEDTDDFPSLNKHPSSHNSKEIQEKGFALSGQDYKKIDSPDNLEHIKNESYFKDLTNNEVIENSDSDTNMSVDHSTPVGGTTISVENFCQNDSKFIIYSSSKYRKNGFKMSSELVSIIGMDLATVEENKIRHMKNGDVFNECKCYITSDINMGYDLKITNKDGATKTTDNKYFNNNVAKDCILEGANIVLLRYLAITQYKGEFKTKSISVDGELCDNIYVCNIIESLFAENIKIPLLKVIRKVIDSNCYMKESFFYLTLTGSLVRHTRSDSNYVVHLNPLLPIDPVTNEISRQVPLRKNWQNDMELFSKYMDFKNDRLFENESYFSQHTQLRALLSDYLETILMMKPQEVLPFTRNFFGSFTQQLDLPHNSYFEKI